MLTKNSCDGIISSELRKTKQTEVDTMRTYFYKFADGYFCWTVGKLTGTDRAIHKREHGTIIIEKIC